MVHGPLCLVRLSLSLPSEMLALLGERSVSYTPLHLPSQCLPTTWQGWAFHMFVEGPLIEKRQLLKRRSASKGCSDRDSG